MLLSKLLFLLSVLSFLSPGSSASPAPAKKRARSSTMPLGIARASPETGGLPRWWSTVANAFSSTPAITPTSSARNVRALEIDLGQLDFVVISHRHGDHVAGSTICSGSTAREDLRTQRELRRLWLDASRHFYRRDSTLPDSMRYFGASEPAELRSGTPWPAANSVGWIVSPRWRPGWPSSQPSRRLQERWSSGSFPWPFGRRKAWWLVVGCSHPGIETIVEASRPWGDHVHPFLAACIW